MTATHIKKSIGSVILMGMLSIVPVMTYAQTVEPPISNDEFGWLRWLVIVLLGLVMSGGGAFYVYVTNQHKERISDKDMLINELRTEIAGINARIDNLIREKDLLQKDIRDQVIPALVTSTELMKSLINKN